MLWPALWWLGSGKGGSGWPERAAQMMMRGRSCSSGSGSSSQTSCCLASMTGQWGSPV